MLLPRILRPVALSLPALLLLSRSADGAAAAAFHRAVHPPAATGPPRWYRSSMEAPLLHQPLPPFRRSRTAHTLRMADGDFGGTRDGRDDEEDDEDDAIDPDSLGDWRAFRRDLSLSSTDDGDGRPPAESRASDGGGDKKARKRKSVSKRNEELLLSQSEELGREYLDGVWAHEAPDAEVGGLLCRLPLEAEIYRNSEHSLIGKKLKSRLSLNGDDSGPSSELGYDGDTATTGDDGTGTQASEPTSPSSSSSPGVSFSPLAARTVFWYRGAQSLIRREMSEVTALARDGQIDAHRLGPEGMDMLSMYVDHQDTWQEVCLVLDRDERAGTATTVVLNRPMSFKATENLARLVLFGAFKAPSADDDVEDSASAPSEDLLSRFLDAFGREIGLYVGGPDMMDRPALLVHGIADLEGAAEIASGTGIYVGGTEAAVDGVLRGLYKPLDFRFFVGRHRYEGGTLDLAVRALGKYQPVACARSVALKQCIALPKPLWHEVMELCGGELKEISSLELMKRDDIQIEQVDE